MINHALRGTALRLGVCALAAWQLAATCPPAAVAEDYYLTSAWDPVGPLPPAEPVQPMTPLPDVPPSASGPPAWEPETIPPQPHSGGYAHYDPWRWQILPAGLIFPSYLASVREPRMASVWNGERDLGATWDIALGGKVGLLRYGTCGPRPQGWQLDLDGVAFPRLDLENNADLAATDFRAGLALTWGSGPWAWKFAGYHLSSHIGDEYLIRNPTFVRINYSRNALVWAVSYWLGLSTRLYAEAGLGFYNDGGSEPWEFQFGVDYSPPARPDALPALFWAVNGHLREEVDFGGQFVAQAGWQWRAVDTSHLLRCGFEYYNGKSRQLELFDDFEHQAGLGLWYDF